MGIFKSNLGRISKLFCGNNLTRCGILVAVLTLVLSVELANSFEENDTDTTSTGAPSDPKIIELNLSNPEDQWDVMINDPGRVYSINEKLSGFKIAIHLTKKCHLDSSESITITKSDGNKITWECSPKSISSVEDTEDFITMDMKLRNGMYSEDQNVAVEKVLDDLDWAKIEPSLNNSGRKWKATIIVNLYKDFSENSCPDDMFNCRQSPCPPTCCSDLQQMSGGSKAKSTPGVSVITTSTLFSTPAIWKASPRSSTGARCIPSSLECNEKPNCGMLNNNIDESNQICYPLKYCDCQSICLTWNYVLTSLAIAVLFIITPTAIVFALFHRRNVALERARLLRMAAMRMADMRGEFTRDDPHNDRPPSYDEVYDIKEPPPCFCKAIAMQREYDLQQQCLSSNGTQESGGEDGREETVIENIGSIEFQNLGFQCSCTNVNQQEIPPNYVEVSNSNSTSSGEIEIENSGSNNNRQQPQQTNSSDSSTVDLNHVEMGNVDLDKEQEV